jgi:hypothetical protein
LCRSTVVHTVREGGDQHQEGGFGEVEVREQAANDAEPVPGREEDGGRAGVGFEVEETVSALRRDVGLLGDVFQGAGGGGSNRNDAPARWPARRLSASSGGRGQRVALGVQADLFHPGDPDRLKGSQPDVQRESCDLHAALASGRPGSAGVKCSPAVGAAAEPGCWLVDGLVALAILL